MNGVHAEEETSVGFTNIDMRKNLTVVLVASGRFCVQNKAK